MINGFTGLPGAGKTYEMTRIALKYIKKGVDVYANYSILGARKYDNLLDLLNIRQGVILVDEINLICPSRAWEALPVELYQLWSHERKFGLMIYWTAQSVNRVDKIIREITHYVYDCKKLPIKGFAIRKYEPQDLMKDELRRPRAFSFKLKLFRKKTFLQYNTFEGIEVPEYIKTIMAKKMGLWSYKPKDLTQTAKITSIPPVDISNELPKIRI